MSESRPRAPEYGVSRSSLNIRYSPDATSSVVHALKPQEKVAILSEVGEILEIESTRWQPPVRGFIHRSAIVRAPAKPAVFPMLMLGAGVRVPAVPISLPLQTFQQWLDSGEESPWLPDRYAEAMRLSRLPSVGARIRDVIVRNRSRWDAWIAEIQAQGREDSCTLDEWVTLLQGGRDMWSMRAERIFTDPAERSATVGWVVPEDVLRWTGRVQVNQKEPKYKTWFEVELAKADRHLGGWYKADLLEEFIAPTPQTDLTVPQNRERAFDLSHVVIRTPADPEIEDSRRGGRAGAQFIDVRRALGWGQLHHNLCGEFCVAALASLDVIELLQHWLAAYPKAREILANDLGTSIPDLQSMLDVAGLKYEFFRTVGGVSPVTPTYVRRRLDAGQMAVVATGVTKFGAIKSRSGIRHWAVVEDILRVSSSGWVRVYNPFNNRDETYRFDEVYDLPSRDSIGLWVEPRRATAVNLAAASQEALPASALLQPEPALTG